MDKEAATAGVGVNHDERSPEEVPPPSHAPAEDENFHSGVKVAAGQRLPPNGGLKAWLQVVGSFMLFFSSWGLINAFGVYQTYYERGFLSRESPSNISWIGSVQAFLLLFVGALTGPLYDLGYFYSLIATGSFFVVFGMMMTSLCSQFWQVMLAQGICVGLGMGCVFVPSVAILPQYFTSKKALATGLAASGSGLGGIIYPIVFYRLQPRIGFAWATRVLAFIALGTFFISISLMRIRAIPKQKRAFLDLPAFKEPPYVLFTAGFFFGFIGLYIPIFYLQTYAIQEHITNNSLGFYILPILNTGSVFGRVVPSFFTDKAGPLNMLIPCAAACCVLAFAWIRIHDVPGLIVFAALFGIAAGTYVSVPPTAVVSLSPHLSVVGTRMGMCFSIASLGLLIGTPVSGAILNMTGDFLGPQVMSGSALTVAVVLLFAARVSKAGIKLFIKA